MSIKSVRNLRRLSQIVFFVIFFWLILKTTFEVHFTPSDAAEIQLPYPVSIALEFDPLVAFSTVLATGGVFKGLLWSLVILIPTIFLGRFFCGWVCPMGSLNHWVSEIRAPKGIANNARKIKSNRYGKYQRIKYYILFLFLAAAFFGSLQIGLLDPLSLLARSIGTAVLPTIHTAALGVLGWVKGLGVPILATAAQSAYDVTASLLLPYRQAHFHGILLIGGFFLIILILNRLITRLWCRAICPLGAMLGLFSRWTLFGLQKDEATCNHCNQCLIACQGADGPDIGAVWRQAEWHLCLNCQAVCPQSSLKFKFYPQQTVTVANPAGTPKVDVSRRMVMTSLVGGVALVPLLRSGDAFEVNSDPRLIRPPGSLSESEFIARCIRCGQCMRVCPNNALHPTLLQAGAEGIWSPVLIPRIGYCEPTCTLCGQVCPTGAIAELTLTRKVGNETVPPNRIGTAFIDRGRCLPWAMAIPCIVCEEWCPTSPKAIYFAEETAIDRKKNEVKVKRPSIDPEFCTGCGACEYACPVADRAAIYVTSVGESRSTRNQLLLKTRNLSRPPGRTA
jgi:polyferredoxin